jgi:glutathione S-transferase
MAAKIKIWGRNDSSNVQKVLWCCGELGIDFDRVDLGGRFGGNKEQPYLHLNPNGLVPTIDDAGLILWESNTIVRYLTEKYGGGKIIEATPEGRAQASRWMDWQLTTLGPAIVPLFWGYVRTPPEKRDAAALKTALEKTAAAWKIVDDRLAQNAYLAGKDFTIGDIPLGVWAYRWFNLPIERPKLDNFSRWYGALQKRPAYQKHIMIPMT